MCRPARCSSCGNTTWAGCGQHVDQVMAGVSAEQRCRCDRSAGRRVSTTGSRPSLLRRLRGR